MFDSETFEESRLNIKIAMGAKETSTIVKLRLLALQADALAIVLAGPSLNVVC